MADDLPIFDQLQGSVRVGSDDYQHVGGKGIEPLLKGIYEWLFPFYQGERGALAAWGGLFVGQLQDGGLGLINRIREK